MVLGNSVRCAGFGQQLVHTSLGNRPAISGQTAFVEVLNSSDKVIHQEAVIDGVADCLNMPAGDVYVRLVIDTNDDFLWTPGNYDTKRQPEQVFYLNKKISLKANWEINETWNIWELPFEKQKPKELIKKEEKKR